MNEDKMALYILIIVGVIAVLGIIVLLLNSTNTFSDTVSTGQAYQIKSIYGTKEMVSTTTGVECCDYTAEGHCITKCH